MSKVMLVIDEPESCFKCPCFDSEYEPSCKVEKYSTDGWCPLRPLPERMTANLYYRKTDYICDWKERSCGWNECLDEILREKQ